MDWYETVKGRIVGSVRGKERMETIAKYVGTALRNQRISFNWLDRVLAKVGEESIKPFLGAPWNQPERQQRFETLRRTLKSLSG